jgi:hypothetical protein
MGELLQIPFSLNNSWKNIKTLNPWEGKKRVKTGWQS